MPLVTNLPDPLTATPKDRMKGVIPIAAMTAPIDIIIHWGRGIVEKSKTLSIIPIAREKKKISVPITPPSQASFA